MKQHYYALKASLPMLLPDAPLPITREKFLEYCEAYLPARDMEILRSLSLTLRELPPGISAASAAGQYILWEISLRNTLGALRAGKLGFDPEPYLVKFAEFESDAFRTATELYSTPMNPLEREHALDAARWFRLDCVTGLHQFDFDALCIYLFRLLIQEKWSVRNSGNSEGNLDAAAKEASENIK